VPLHGADLVDPLQDRANPVYPLIVELGLDYLLADGFLVNTFDAMEHDTLVAFKELSDKGVYPPAYAVGPLVRSPSGEAENDTCIRWLDEQPDGSVMYVCFGTGGTLSVAQTAELAAGLEASGQRFLWVVRFPSDKDVSASYFGTNNRGDDDDPTSYLPEGFVERTKGAGLAVPLWAPQVEVLNHRAVGGFVTHCGWNSTLEAASAGVPTLAWPLFAEQKMNAVMLSPMARPMARHFGPTQAQPKHDGPRSQAGAKVGVDGAHGPVDYQRKSTPDASSPPASSRSCACGSALSVPSATYSTARPAAAISSSHRIHDGLMAAALSPAARHGCRARQSGPTGQALWPTW